MGTGVLGRTNGLSGGERGSERSLVKAEPAPYHPCRMIRDCSGGGISKEGGKDSDLPREGGTEHSGALSSKLRETTIGFVGEEKGFGGEKKEED